MSKVMLKTLKHMSKKVELRKRTAKEIVLKADRSLFAQVIVITEAWQLSKKEVLSHPLGLWQLLMALSRKQRNPH